MVFLGLYPDALEEVEKEAIDTLTLYAQQGSRTVLMFNPGVSESTSPFRKDIDRRKDEEDDTPASPEARESTEAPEAPVVQEAPDAPSPPPAPIPPPAEDTGEKADEKAAEDEGKPEREPYDPYEKLHVEFYKENGLTLGKKEEWEFGGAGKATLDSEYTGGDELPESIPWHGRYYFKETGPEWRTVYTADGLPVIIEKPVDDGTFVLATDSYLLSNEALLNDRQ
ncbi:MAG: hypothetical protein GWO24_21745, partial [Akkermansiaceae bacterium]|nr:hypothetical protein [Akkermansiaceae bacterium]